MSLLKGALIGALLGTSPLMVAMFLYFVLGWTAYSAGLVVAYGLVSWSGTFLLNALWIVMGAVTGAAHMASEA